MPVQSPSVSNISLLDPGIQVWSTIGSQLRWRFQPPVSGTSVIPSNQLIKQFIDGLTFISFLLLLTVATIPISLYFCCRGFSKPNKNLVIHSHRKHITALGIGLAFVCVIIAVICGTRGNELVSRFVQSVPSTATSLSFDASFTISQVPTVVSNALSSLELSVNQTVETEVSKLPIPISDFKSAGIPLLSVLKTLSALQTWTSTNATSTDSKISTLNTILTHFLGTIQSINTQLTSLNKVYAAPTPSRLMFQLKNQLPLIPIQQTSALAAFQNTLSPILSNPLSKSLTSPQGLPDASVLLPQLQHLLSDNGTLEIQSKIASAIKSLLQQKLTVSAQTAAHETTIYAQNMTAFITKLNTTIMDTVHDLDLGKWDLVRGVGFMVVYGWGCLICVGLVVVVWFQSARVLRGIVVPQIAIVTCLALIIAAVLFAVSVGVGETCRSLTTSTTTSVLFMSLSESITNTTTAAKLIQQFIQARDTCLTDAPVGGGLIEFAETMGVNPQLVNLTLRAAPIIQIVNLTSYVSQLDGTALFGMDLADPKINSSIAQLVIKMNSVTENLTPLVNQNADFS
ncbi:hypothetical protein HDU99_004967, partial [Rhizoclosmatium hyalinum]